jgi:hypothetical protein
MVHKKFALFAAAILGMETSLNMLDHGDPPPTPVSPLDKGRVNIVAQSTATSTFITSSIDINKWL